MTAKLQQAATEWGSQLQEAHGKLGGYAEALETNLGTSLRELSQRCATLDGMQQRHGAMLRQSVESMTHMQGDLQVRR